ncbi:MAG: response regulator [Alphaproteobacteria bacterium]|nr:response regulator [Alphaproteobacteria bacterium]
MPAALVERALRATRRGAELTRRLLAFSRRQTLQPERIELNALVTSLTDLLSRTLGENIRVETELADDVGTVVVDPGQLENALLNLAVNARDAMPRGGRLLIESANVELDADYVAAVKDVLPGPYVMLAVSDTGEGMTPEIVSRAFEPFFTTKEVGKGSGLGLSMVYGFVKQSGGHVAIYSEVSLGTTIRLYLPRTAVSGVASPHVKPAVAGQDGNGQHVLVVEDDPDVRQLVATQLGARGYAVQAAASGREAMALIAGAAPIDLLLTDVVLPGGMSGADIVARARHHRPGLRVLYMSGYTEGMINMDLLRADNAHFLQKPFTRIQLAHAVREALEAGEDVS